jgi:hypothetical protein
MVTTDRLENLREETTWKCGLEHEDNIEMVHREMGRECMDWIH